MHRRLAMAAAAASLIALATAPAVGAMPPLRESFENDVDLVATGLCTFPVTVSIHQEWSGSSRFDAQGNLVAMEYRVTGRDTFSAMRSLEGEPYTTHLSMLFDANGDAIMATGAGIVEKIRLPDGRMLVAAGWLSYLDKPEDFFGLSPDRGSQLDVEALCEALS